VCGLYCFLCYSSSSPSRIPPSELTHLAMEEQHNNQPKPNNIYAFEGDPFLLNYSSLDLRIASEFLATWLPFLSLDLCTHCTQSLSDHVQSIDPGSVTLTFLPNSRFFFFIWVLTIFSYAF